MVDRHRSRLLLVIEWYSHHNQCIEMVNEHCSVSPYLSDQLLLECNSIGDMDWYLLHTLCFDEPWKYAFVSKVARTWRGESKGFLGSIVTPTWVLGSLLTPVDVLKSFTCCCSYFCYRLNTLIIQPQLSINLPNGGQKPTLFRPQMPVGPPYDKTATC